MYYPVVHLQTTFYTKKISSILSPKKSNHDVNQREKVFAIQLPVFLPEIDYYQLHEEVHHIFP